MAHNEDEQRKRIYRRLFFPGFLRFSLEAFVAAVLLVVINFAAFEKSLLKDYPSDLTFTSYSSGLLDVFLTIISQVSFMDRIIIFVVWTVVGMLAYILVFRVIQVIYGISSSVSTGIKYIHTEHTHGIIHWLGTLHNFFLLSVTIFISMVLCSMAIFLAFVVASQQVQTALSKEWPDSITALGVSFLATTIGVRLVIMGICLTIPRFARWYLS